MTYQPPYTITPDILSRVAEISEWIGRYTVTAEVRPNPGLRRGNRLRTIQASLEIEQNTLTLEQVTAIIEGQRVLGPPKEIQEVRNAFAAYEQMEQWQPASRADLLTAHGVLMQGLIDRPGQFRTGGVGVARGEQVIHVAPPAENVPGLMNDLLGWLKTTDAHPLISSAVFHYELTFIHPFSDGNGRMARLWQTLILSRWKALLAWLPVETVIRDRQDDYYQVLAACDKVGNSTAFIEFGLTALTDALREVMTTEQVGEYVTEQVQKLIHYMPSQPISAAELMQKVGLSHRPTFLYDYLQPALHAGLIEMTIPDKPRSSKQRYRLTGKGRLHQHSPFEGGQGDVE